MTVMNINATWMQPSCTATGTPILRMLPSTSGWGRRSLRLTWMFVRRLLSHTSARATLAVWAVTVPSAAPTGPSVFPHFRTFANIMMVYPISLGTTAFFMVVAVLLCHPARTYRAAQAKATAR